MIASFGDKDTALAFEGRRARRSPGQIAAAAGRKLQMIEAAAVVDDLRSPPGNRLELLRGDRAGQHSIRINDQWRITFAWRDGAAHGVLMEDHH